MTNRHSPERLSEELRHRADPQGGHPISLDDVKRSATKMKWQQRAVGVGLAAAVLAIAVPVGLAVTDDGGRDDGRPAPVATPTPTKAAPTPVVLPDGSIDLRMDGAPQGEPPLVGWLDRGTLRLPDGKSVRLPQMYGDVVAYGGGWLGRDHQDFTIDKLTADGRREGTVPGGGMATSADGNTTAWFEKRPGRPGLLHRVVKTGTFEGESTVEIPEGAHAEPVAFLDSSIVLLELQDQRTSKQTVWYAEGEPMSITQITDALAVGGASQSTQRMAVMTSATDDGSCWEVRPMGGGESPDTPIFSTCDYSLGEFSSDGRYVLGWPAYADGWGPGQVAILDATTGKPVVSWDSPEDLGISTARWDGTTDNLVAVVKLDRTWQLVRLRLDGVIERLAEPVADPDDVVDAYRLVSVR